MSEEHKRVCDCCGKRDLLQDSQSWLELRGRYYLNKDAAENHLGDFCSRACVARFVISRMHSREREIYRDQYEVAENAPVKSLKIEQDDTGDS